MVTQSYLSSQGGQVAAKAVEEVAVGAMVEGAEDVVDGEVDEGEVAAEEKVDEGDVEKI